MSWAEDEEERVLNEEIRRLEEDESRWNSTVEDEEFMNTTALDSNSTEQLISSSERRKKLRKFVDVTLEEMQENNSTE